MPQIDGWEGLASIFKKLGVLDILFGEKHVGRERICATFDFPMCDVKGWHVRSSTVQQDANLTPRSLHKATGLNSVNAKKRWKHFSMFFGAKNISQWE